MDPPPLHTHSHTHTSTRLHTRTSTHTRTRPQSICKRLNFAEELEEERISYFTSATISLSTGHRASFMFNAVQVQLPVLIGSQSLFALQINCSPIICYPFQLFGHSRAGRWRLLKFRRNAFVPYLHDTSLLLTFHVI